MKKHYSHITTADIHKITHTQSHTDIRTQTYRHTFKDTETDKHTYRHQGVYKFNRANFQAISRRFQKGF